MNYYQTLTYPTYNILVTIRPFQIDYIFIGPDKPEYFCFALAKKKKKITSTLKHVSGAA